MVKSLIRYICGYQKSKIQEDRSVRAMYLSKHHRLDSCTHCQGLRVTRQSEEGLKGPVISTSTGRTGVYLAIGFALILGQVFVARLTRRGLDITDEGYYLNSIHWASHYKTGLSGFGDFYSTFYLFLGQDFGLLRELTSWFNWGLWVVFGLLFMSYLTRYHLLKFRWEQLVVGVLVMGAFSNFTLQWWLSTPSYNTLAFQGVMFFAIGLLMQRIWGAVSVFALSLGLVVSFIAKPSTTVALVVLLLLAVPPLSIKNVLVFAGSGIASLSMLAFWGFALDGSLLGYFNRIMGGLQFLSVMDGGQLIWEGSALYRVAVAFWPFVGVEPWSLALLCLAILGLTLSTLYWSRSATPKNTFGRLAPTMGFIVFSLSVLLLLLSRGERPISQIVMVVFVSVSLMVITSILGSNRRNEGHTLQKLRTLDWRFSLTLFLLPLAYVFGTNTNYWSSAASMGGLFISSSLLVGASYLNVKSTSTAIILRVTGVSLVAGIVVLSSTVLGAAMNPYRQDQAISEMKASNVFSGIYVSKSVAEYTEKLRDVKKKYGLDSSTPIIDNTGASPGALFVLGGLPIGAAWIGGDYPGSQKLARILMAQYSEECVKSAWVLDSPSGSTRVFDFHNHWLVPESKSRYVAVAEFRSPISGEEQVLYRPNSPTGFSSEACEQILGP